MLTTDDRQVPFDERRRQPAGQRPCGGSDDRAHTFTVGHTWVISSTMVNSFRVVGNDVYADKPGPEFFSPQDVGINAYTYVPGFTGRDRQQRLQRRRRLVRHEPLRGHPERRRQRRLHGGPRAPTSSAFGGHYLWSDVGIGRELLVAVGRYTFTGQFTGNAMADFFAGRIGFHRQARPEPRRSDAAVRRPLRAGHVEARIDVTLNYGVEWNPSCR